MGFFNSYRLAFLFAPAACLLTTAAHAQIQTTGQLRPNPPRATSPETPQDSEPSRGEVEATNSTEVDAAKKEETVTSRQPEREQDQTTASIEEGGELHLVCFGAGAANRPDVRSGSGTFSAAGSDGSFASGNASATSYGTRSQNFEDQVTLTISLEEGRLRMPRTMLPVVRGGQDGWFELRNIEVEQGELRASVAVNFMNRPRLRLDRYTGSISISGRSGDYSGQCERIDHERQERQF